MAASPALFRRANIELERIVIPRKGYHSPLPSDLDSSYCYTLDGGHSIIVVLENRYREALARSPDALIPSSAFMVPAPVRTVLRQGYTIKQHLVECDVVPLVWCQIPCSSDGKLITEEGDYEFGLTRARHP